MKLLFKQRMFSWFDSYDIYNEFGEPIFEVRGQLSWGHCFKIFDKSGHELGCVNQRIFTFLPKFEMYINGNCVGCISKEFSWFKPRFNMDYCEWHVEGDFWEWDYRIQDALGETVAIVSKELWNWTDTYSIDVKNPNDALLALMLVLAIDAEKCSRD